MMKRPFAYLLTAFTLCAAAQAADHTYKPPPASEYADVETHANESVTGEPPPLPTPTREVLRTLTGTILKIPHSVS